MRKSDGEFLGQCELVRWNIRGQEDVEIGYRFIRKYWKQGYATEAARACRDLAFQKLQIPQVVSFIDPKNTPSQKVALGTGMQRESTCRATPGSLTLVPSGAASPPLRVPGAEDKFIKMFVGECKKDF